jgi:hypothetical protein
MGYQLSLDRIGWTYVGIFILWNVLLSSGCVFLWTYRHHPSLRMRRLPLLFTGVGVLHIYGSLCCIGTYNQDEHIVVSGHEYLLTISPSAYPFGAAFDCSIEFWMMSITVPLGMGE